MPFIWDRGEDRLYLDSNRNRDLSDEPAHIPAPGSNSGYQQFTNIQLSFKTSQGVYSARFDLGCYGRRARPTFTLASRSIWEAKLTAQDQEWQVGLLDDLSRPAGQAESSFMALRPWSEREEPFEASGGSLAALTFPRKVFFGQKGYHLTCKFVQDVGGPAYQLDISEVPVELGTLRFTGRHLSRVTMASNSRGENFVIVLDKPSGEVKVPVGTYQNVRVALRAGDMKAMREQDQWRGTGSGSEIVTVEKNREALLTAGGPLTNTVTVDRRGNHLLLGYRLLGAGGQPYQMLGERRRPGFAIFKGDKQLFAGKFEFG